jgi:hypothetical protein
LSKKKKNKQKDTVSSFKLRRLPLEKVKKGLMNTGLPFELHLTNQLRRAKWGIQRNVPYEDYTGNESVERTLDILASKKTEIESEAIGKFQLSLLIECKQQSDSAWVFDASKKRKIDWENPLDAQLYCGDSVVQTSDYWKLLYRGIGQSSHQNPDTYDGLSNAGVTYIQSGGEKFADHPDLLFKGSRQVTSALEYLNARYSEWWKSKNPAFHPVFWRNYPVIVFNGSLYRADMVKGKLQLKEVEYLHYYPKTTERGYLIDIVRADFFPKYLEIVGKEFEMLHELLDGIVTIKKP